MTQEKQDRSRDHLLGMDQSITRRDFLNGIAIGITAAASGSVLAATPPNTAASDAPPGAAQLPSAAQDAAGYYPPLLTGMRGSHPGSFEDAHALRDGKTWPAATDTGEEYDLIVVGAGISVLAAAHFYRAQKADSRILILDNHDDFGGHAKRNEFNLGGRIQLLNGGTLEVDSPHAYGATATGLLKDLGVDIPALVARKAENRDYYQSLGLRLGAFLDAETF